MGWYFVRATAVACVALFISACANLEVFHLKEDGPKPMLIGKIPYYLPRTAVNITGTLTVTKCSVVEDKIKHQYNATLEIEGSFSPAVVTEPDPEYQFYIDYEKSRSLFKEINFTIDTYANKTLQNFNSVINDQAGAIGIAGALAFVQIAGAARIPSASGRFAAVKVEAIEERFCASNVRDGLKKLAEDRDVLDSAKKIPDPTKSAEAIVRAQAEMVKTTKKYNLAYVVNKKWVPTGTITAGSELPGKFSTTVDLSPAIRGWLAEDAQGWFDGKPVDSGISVDWGQAKQPLVVQITVDRQSTGINSAAEMVDGKTYQQVLDAPAGLVIRDPASGVLQVCQPDCPPVDDLVLDGKREKASRMTVTLPQFGRLLVLPQHSILFENSTLNVKMNADGTIASVGYKSSSTAAAGLKDLAGVGAAAASAEAARNTAIGAQNAAKTAQAQYANTVNKALADCLTAYASLVKLGVTPPMECH